jgi:serine/threonine protein kinase
LKNSLAKDLISRLLKKDYLERYTAKEALNHPWFSKEGKGLIPLRLFETYRMYDAKFALKKVFYFFKLKALTALVILNACKEQSPMLACGVSPSEAQLVDVKDNRSLIMDSKSFLTTVGLCILNKSSSQKKRILRRDHSFEPTPVAQSKANLLEQHSASTANAYKTVVQPLRQHIKNAVLNIASKSLRRKVVPSKVLADLDQLLYQRGNKNRNPEIGGIDSTSKSKVALSAKSEWRDKGNRNSESEAHNSAALADSQLSIGKGNPRQISKVDVLDANYFEKVRLYKYHFQGRFDKENLGARKTLLGTAEEKSTGKGLGVRRSKGEFGEIRAKLQSTHKAAKLRSGDVSGGGSILFPLKSKEPMSFKHETEQELVNKTSTSIPQASRNWPHKAVFVIRTSNREVLGQ